MYYFNKRLSTDSMMDLIHTTLYHFDWEKEKDFPEGNQLSICNNFTATVCIKKMATRIITAYNSPNSYQIIIILTSQETLFFCLSNDVFFVEIEKVEEEEIEKKDSENFIIFLTIN